MHSEKAILIDWGMTNVRAWRLGDDGSILARQGAPDGIGRLGQASIADAFDRLTKGWLADDPSLPILMSGMIGGREGWIEAPYCDCPVGLSDLAASVVPLPARPGVRVVPGIRFVDGSRRDLMRGEEVQIFGAIGDDGAETEILCLPGTHSKWVRFQRGKIREFHTSMTGEIFAILREHSSLGRLMPCAEMFDVDVFMRGLRRSNDAGGLLHHIFSVRSEALHQTISRPSLHTYLSGILIGHEVSAMQRLYAGAAGVTLVGAPDLSARYAMALQWLDMASNAADVETATVTGLRNLHEALRSRPVQ